MKKPLSLALLAAGVALLLLGVQASPAAWPLWSGAIAIAVGLLGVA